MTEFFAVLKRESHSLTVIVNKRDISLTAVTADTVFLFQEVGKFLSCRVIRLAFALFIELLNSDLAVYKACSTVNFSSQRFKHLNTVHNRPRSKLRFCLIGCFGLYRLGITEQGELFALNVGLLPKRNIRLFVCLYLFDNIIIGKQRSIIVNFFCFLSRSI